MIATFIVSRYGLLHLHRGAAAVAVGEAEGLPRQGPMLLLARRPQWLVGGKGSGHHAWAQRCPRRQVKRAADQKQRQEAVGRRGGVGEEAARDDHR